ncbi:uncharacterized protein LOC121246940 [Juglans microcarpa x Juglans regia]|uniref:uncharacterized protein LOC121246940 n=1 Tax=Juglans microcarpa x Juglans regia TaxID=2249226 RepID=UPI001B7E8EC4|nr:uncharacterized protein LOC121246940 [Juglans microcarpa x Juglans regia]XP_041001198.1 uncharacterized protein LOC121246940 [Juglans microcarpa x Juglans regia]
MGLEGRGDNKLLGLRMTSKHKRSKSFPDKKIVEQDGINNSFEASDRKKLDMGHLRDIETKKKQSPKAEVQNSLKQEILQLEKRLQDQFEVRHALEKALGYRSSSHDNTAEILMPKPATELIKEIAVLELEVVYLEHYLLSLYRKAFDQQVSSVSPSAKDERLKSPINTPRGRIPQASSPDITSKRESSAIQSGCQLLEDPVKESNGIGGEEKLLYSGVHRCHSSLSQHPVFFTRTSPPADSLDKALRACHSQPLSMTEYAQNASSNIISLAEHLGTRISDHVPETSNRLSEDMIKCISALYCKLTDPPLTHNGLSSPNSSMSSMSAFSLQDHGDMWSPGFRNNSSFDVRLDNPFHVEGLKEFSGPYSTMVEVPWIYRDGQKLGDTEHLLQNFRSLICQLEDVDPRKLKHEEKLAFWINIHNALVMHAFLAYGIPQNNVKRVFLLLKAAYNIGGQVISADTIQSSILGCRMSRPGQWLRFLLSPRMKFKSGDERQAYAIEHPEPLLHFALCSGSHSDPAVRVYTPERVFQELESAKEEYIRATYGVSKNHKILLPKMVESFMKDSGLCPAGVMEMIQQSLPESLRKNVKQYQLGKSRKSIVWVPHNFTFRYLISKELVK